MIATNSVPMPNAPARADASRPLNSPEMIDRLATEMRARCGGELAHSFYVEQVKRQLSGRFTSISAANDEPGLRKAPEQPSVFSAWAMPEWVGTTSRLS